MSLLTVGTVAFDDIETPFGRAEMAIGGAAMYISLAASYFTSECKTWFLLSEMIFQHQNWIICVLEALAWKDYKLKRGEKSFFWAGKYHYNLNDRDTLDTQLNVLADFDPVLPDSYKDAEFLMLGNLTPDVQIRVLEQMNKRPTLIALDTMNFWMDNALDRLKEVIKRIDVLNH